MSNHQDPYVVIETFMKRKYGDKFYNKQEFDYELWKSYIANHAAREGGKSKKKDKDIFEQSVELRKLIEKLGEDEEEDEDYYIKVKNKLDDEINIVKKRLKIFKDQYDFVNKKYKIEKGNPLFNKKKFDKAFDKLNTGIRNSKMELNKLQNSKEEIMNIKQKRDKEEKKYEKRIKPIKEKQLKEIEQEDELRSALSRLKLV